MPSGVTSDASRSDATCAVNVSIYAPPRGQREYIYNLLPQINKDVVTSYSRLPKIRKPGPEKPKVEKPQKTMGPPSHDKIVHKLLPDKWPYLMKQSKLPFVKQIPGQANRRCYNAGTKETGDGAEVVDDVPTTKCRSRTGHKVNWIVRNAVSAITAKPGYRIAPVYKPLVVDTRNGHRYPLVSERTVSGMEPLYVYKMDMGQVPNYIRQRWKMRSATEDNLKHYWNEKKLQQTDYLLTGEQREELLTGLKASWDAFNRKYLKLASASDTMKAKAYKGHLENQLDSVKKDIDLVENHQFIFIEATKGETADIMESENICDW